MESCDGEGEKWLVNIFHLNNICGNFLQIKGTLRLLGFEQIERILDAKLPSSAHEYRQWWDNEKEGNHVNTRAWANAGWKVENVDFDRKQVRLVRV